MLVESADLGASQKLGHLRYGRDPSFAKGLAAANPRIKWPFACRVETIYAQDYI